MKRAILFMAIFCAFVPAGSQTRDYNYCSGTPIGSISETFSGWSCASSRNSYRWLYSTDGATWEQHTASKPLPCDNLYTCMPVNRTGTTLYKVVALVSGLNQETGTVHRVTIYPSIIAPVAGTDQTICYNTAPATVSATPASGGNGNFSYQWQSRNDNTQWTDEQGADQVSFSPTYLTTTTYYRLRARSGSGCGDVYSNTVTVNVYGRLSSGGVTGTQSTCYGDDAAPLIGSTATGGDGAFNYEWQYSYDNAGWGSTGVTALSFSPKDMERTTYYRVLSSNQACGQVASATVTVQVYPQISGGTIGQAQTICYNTSPNNLVGSEATGGYGLYTYEWQYSLDNNNFYPLPNTDTRDYHPVMLTNSTWYRRKVTDNCGTAYSNTVLITVHGELKGTAVSGNQSICRGTNAGTLTGENPTGGDGSYTYRWQKSTDNFSFEDIVNSNTRDYQPYNITETTYFRRVTTTGSCGGATSNTVTVAIKPGVAPGSIGSDQAICHNTRPVAIANVSSPMGNYTTKWQMFANSTWSDVPGATELGYWPGELTSTVRFRRVVTDECGLANSNEVTVTVLPAVNPGTVASDQTVCYRGTANSLVGGLPSGAEGQFTYLWQWSLDRVNWNGITGTNMLNYPPGTLERTTHYRRMAISNKCGEAPSNTVTVTVHPELKNTNIAGDQMICSGAVINTLTGETPTGGDGNYTYKWQMLPEGGNWGDIVNSNTKDYQPVGLTQTASYRRITYTGSCGNATSNTVTVTVRTGVTPGSIGSDQVICYNTKPATITNTVTPTGTYTTKWHVFINNTWSEVPGITDLSYSPGELISTTKYRRTVTDVCGSANSNEATITVLPQANPGTIAADQTICYKAVPNALNGNGATGAEGSFTYRWQLSPDKVTWGDIASSNSIGYLPGSLDKTAYYRRIAVSDKCGEAPSNVVTISVHPELRNVNIASDQTICSEAVINGLTGETPTGGDGNYTYKWQMLSEGGNWGDIVNSNTKDYQPVGLTQTASYRRITYTGSCGNATSNTVTVTVRTGVTPGSIGSDQVICYNTKPATITNTVTPTGTYTTKWYIFTNNTWSEVPGITDLSYSPGELISTTKYRRTVTDICGSANSNEATITVLPQANPGTIAADQTICYKAVPNALNGNGATGAEGSFTYRWQSSPDKVTWGDIASSNSTGYLPGSLEKTTHYRRMAISNKCGEAPSNTVTVTVHPELKNTNIAGDQMICSGAVINTLTGETPTGGDGNYTYKWQMLPEGGNWGDIVNSNTKDYQPVGLTQTASYRRITYTGSCGNATSNTVTVTVRLGVTPGSIGSDQVICYNTKPASIVNSVTPTGNYTTKWHVFTNNTWSEVPGITDLSYSPGELISTTKYRRTVTDVCGSANSNEVTVTVLPKATPGTIAADQTICYKAVPNALNGNGATGAEGSFTYRWQSSPDKVTWGDIASSNSTGYLPGSLERTTHYRRMAISDKCGETPSNTVTVTVHSDLTNTNIAGDQVICSGGTINGLTGETPIGADGNYTYKWQKSTDGTPWGDIVNSNTKDFQPSGLSQTTYFKRVTASANCGSATSNMVTVTVTPELAPGSISSAQVICEGTRPLELTGTSAAGQPDFSYQWQSSSSGDHYDNIAGANSQNYWPEAMGASKYFRRQVSGKCAPKYTNAVFISVLPKPDVPSVQVKTSYCKGEVIALTGGSGQFGHEWYDREGVLLRTGNTYTVPGIENDIKLLVRAVNQNNCRSAAQTLDLMLDKVKAGFTANTFLVNKGEFVQFTSSSTNANSHLWNFSEGEGSVKTNPVKYFYSAGTKDVKLTVTSGAGCRDSVMMKNYITVSAPTGIESITKGGFALYPTLTNDQVTIEAGRTSSFEVYIINWEGKVTMVKKALNLNALSISVGQLPQGAYLVKIVRGRETATFKFTRL